MWHEIKGCNSFGVSVMIYVVYMFTLSVSSPYLFVFGDDRVRGTREQMMLQMDLMRHKAGAGARLEKFYQILLCF